MLPVEAPGLFAYSKVNVYLSRSYALVKKPFRIVSALLRAFSSRPLAMAVSSALCCSSCSAALFSSSVMWWKMLSDSW